LVSKQAINPQSLQLMMAIKDAQEVELVLSPGHLCQSGNKNSIKKNHDEGISISTIFFRWMDRGSL